jgi:hypothetical protein
MYMEKDERQRIVVSGGKTIQRDDGLFIYRL